MSNDFKVIVRGAAGFLSCCLLGFLAFELLQFSQMHESPVESWTEHGQAVILGLSALIMTVTAAKSTRFGGGLWLVAGFLTSLFIREIDGPLDLIFHGSWKYFLMAYLAVLAWLIRGKGVKTVVPGLAHFIGSRAFPLMCVGVSIILCYSRLYGMKALWRVYGGTDWQAVKAMSEESTELLGYMIILAAVVTFVLSTRGINRDSTR